MELTVNGDVQEQPPGTTVAAIVGQVLAPGSSPAGVAVAVDGVVVPRTRWDTTALADGARVEVVSAVAGGCEPGEVPSWTR